MLAVVVLIPLAAFEAVQVLPTATLAYSRSRQSGERVVELMDTPVPVTEPANGRRLDRANLWPISLRRAGARWPATHSSAPAAVAGVDLELMPGRTVAVVGESGSGKTTLSAMLLRFVELSSGSYHLGGVNARDISGDEIRRMVGLCAQDAHIFDSTIRENLRLARPDCDDDDLRDALRRVRLLDWVERCPTAWTPRSGRADNDCRKENVGGYLWRGCCWPTSPRSYSTNPQPISTSPSPMHSCATSLLRPLIARLC